MRRRLQRGVALVLAMGVAALAALVASAILVGQGTAFRQAELQSAQLQARSLAAEIGRAHV